ncbi:MAG: aminotransferase class I/II-fold pyridoxal phosphate-dependent enzyme [Succinivibrionaceae bacterium]
MNLAEFLDIPNIINTIKNKDLYRQCPTVLSRSERTVTIGNKTYLNFASNDYLGLASNPLLINAIKEGVEKYGVGTGASAIVTGNTVAHEELAEKLKDITKKEKVLILNSGFSANQSLIKAFNKLGADLILDKLVHSSMQDAATSAKSFHRYVHNNVNKAYDLIKKFHHPVLFTEGVFSMDGDCADLKTIANIKNSQYFPVVLDDAHGFGVIGKNGTGTLSHLELPYDVADVYMGTCSKALGVAGAFIASDKYFIDYLVNTSREFIYSTSAPAFMAHAINKALDLAINGDDLRNHLQKLLSIFKTEIQKKYTNFATNSITSIQPIIIGETTAMQKIASHLKEKGIWCGAIRPPTVPQHTSRLRITITAGHKEEDIYYLVESLCEALECNHITL